MAVQPLNLPGYAAPQALDFTSLANLGQVYTQAKDASLEKQTLANLGRGPDGKIDTAPLINSGNLKLSQLGIQIDQRQQEMDRQGRLDQRQTSRDAVSDRQHAESMALQRANAARLADRTPAGFAANPDGSYRAIPGGPADPDYLARKGGDLPSGFQRDPATGGMRPIQGGPADPAYLRTKGDRQNAPSGYKWVDPENPNAGMTPIPGGPGEKVDAEVAGRLGLARSFLGQLPDIRKRVEAGEITGPLDAGMAKLGMGGPGEIRRQMDSGAEALLRMLTGAGMNMEEAKEYTRRYRFDPTDNSKTVGSKLNQLERELNSVGETVGKGRGGWQSPSATPKPSGPVADPLGIR